MFDVPLRPSPLYRSPTVSPGRRTPTSFSTVGVYGRYRSRQRLLEQVPPLSHVVCMPGLGQRLKDLLRRAFEEPSAEAHLRGLELLKANLSPAQRHQLESLNYFEVIGGDKGARYRINFGHTMNVQVSDDRGNSMYLCFMPRGQLPTGDTMLAQKIALEVLETDALRIANLARGLSDRPPYALRFRALRED
jgi:hypothetical protein